MSNARLSFSYNPFCLIEPPLINTIFPGGIDRRKNDNNMTIVIEANTNKQTRWGSNPDTTSNLAILIFLSIEVRFLNHINNI